MREAPDVILIGEIRDRETMQAALDLAGTGHLAIATLHANNAPETLDRIINMYPNDQHKQIFMDLAQYIRAIISQRLVRAKEGKRVAAVEVMLNTPHLSEMILKGDISAVKEAFKETKEPGMRSFDEALFNLYKTGEISMEEALSNADSRSNLEAKINFG
jgi:twitching motility protein PilU